MADIVDKVTRSRMMSLIRGNNTKSEIRVRSLIHRQGFRFRINVRNLLGKPDIVLPRFHAVIFVHGCFWHGHDCPLFKWPNTRIKFWRNKIEGNQQHDQKVILSLYKLNWRVATVWECSMKGRHPLDNDLLAKSLAKWIRSKNSSLELKWGEK
jgi:DNA mismatch endonuclease (patch repair protein)